MTPGATAGSGVRQGWFSPRVQQRLFRTRAEDALPYTATHHRVYIVPSKRGFALMCALLLMLIASINYALSLGYALSFLLTGLFAASLLHTYKNLVGIEVRDIGVEHGFVGDTVVFRFALHNHTATTRHGIRINTALGSTDIVAVPPGETATAQLTLPAHARGRLALGRLTLHSNWPLGLWSVWSYLHTPREALVYPKPETDPPPLPTSGESDDGDTRRAAQDGEVSGFRAYRPGDSLGAIAWKQAAKGTGLHVRTFESTTHPTSVALSTQATALLGLEDQLERLCAWVIAAHASGADYSLSLPGKSVELDGGDAQRLRALEALALCRPSK